MAGTGEARIDVRVTPRAARDAISGWRDGVLLVRVTAPPVEGQANAALEKLLAAALGVPKSSVAVVSGKQSRDKTVAVAGLDRHDIERRLSAAAAPR
jgi:uncharacterized protein (TIGR00251 family)